jgi:hypothetical protein
LVKIAAICVSNIIKQQKKQKVKPEREILVFPGPVANYFYSQAKSKGKSNGFPNRFFFEKRNKNHDQTENCYHYG